VLVPGKPLQCNLIFVSRAGAYLSKEHFRFFTIG
jgi:hypothetical protein